jgi:ATP-binding cassette subfamily B protein
MKRQGRLLRHRESAALTDGGQSRARLVKRLQAAAWQALRDSREQAIMRWAAARLAWQSARLTSALHLGVNVASAALLVAYIFFSGELMARVPAAAHGGWGSAAGGAVAGYLAAVGACFLGAQVLAPVKTRLGDLVIRQVDGAVRGRLAAASARVPGLAPFEDQGLVRQLSMANEGLDGGFRSPGEAVSGMATLAGLYVQAYLAALLIAVLLSPLAALGLLAGGLAIRRSHRIGLVLETRSRSRNWDMEREAGYYRQVALDAAAGREIRVFGLAAWLHGRFRRISVEALQASMAIRRRVHGNRFIPPVVFATLAGTATVLWIAAHAGPGGVPLRDLVICLQAGYLCLQIGNYFPEDWQTQYGLGALEALQEFEAGSARLIGDDEGRLAEATFDPAGMPRETLRFDGVSFRYPGAERLVLDGLTLDVQVGKSLAIVGLNGAGKTTIVKLLAGLYQPASGVIRVDGRDLRELRLAAWQRNVAAIYQDFERYQLPAAENIAFGDAADPGRRDDIRWAAAQAGILEVLDGLPLGLDTPLAAGYASGTDLSGGQWQRVALARAFYALRAGARVLVLDEPTASLDVRGEAEFLDRFIELTQGVTTIVISHRFATVRHAAKIVVLSDGRITEQGTHESLLADGGRYAELFRLQAERFADSPQESGGVR